MVRLGLQMHECLASIQSAAAAECVTASPASDSLFPLTIAFEVLRVAFVYVAFGVTTRRGLEP